MNLSPKEGVSADTDAAVEAFLLRCHSKNLARGTIAWYSQILKSLAAYASARNVLPLGDLSHPELRGYLGWRRSLGKSSETVVREWGALKCFYRFLHSDGIIAQDPMARVEKPQRERRLIRPMDMAQVKRLIAQADERTAKGCEDRAIMLLMVDSGLRLAEVLGLELRHVHLEERLVTVFGKGRKERSIPIGAQTAEAISRYLGLRGPAVGALVFVSRDGRPHCPKTIQNRFRAYGRRAELTGVRVSPHTLRHTFAIHYIRNGGDVFSLQNILGHTSLDMVRNYVNLARRDVAEQHRKFSPMDRALAAEASAAEPRGLGDASAAPV